MLNRTANLLLAALITGAASIGFSPSASAQQPVNADSVLNRLRELERQLDSLRAVAERQDTRLMELDERAEGVGGMRAGAGVLADTSRSLYSSRGIYGKPFLRRFGGGTAIGGYVDIEYNNDIDAHESSFFQHRLIPFIFAEITDRLHFGTEIEFEDGGSEVGVEFATLDYNLNDAFNVRAGMILAPLGRFNLVHDSPAQDLTDRPLVDHDIIPTSLSESGVGFFGTLYPSERSLLSYEVYLVNGFDAGILQLDSIGAVSGIRIRDGRGGKVTDHNFGKAIVGRVAFSPILGVELGVSAHTGEFAPQGAQDDRLTIAAFDATVQRGPLELLGEYARADVSFPTGLSSSVSGDQDGFYLQGNYHFGHGWLAPHATSTFTAVARYDRVDFQRGADGDEMERATLGINWRPVEQAVLKTGFQWNWLTPAGTEARQGSERRLVMSMATYF